MGIHCTAFWVFAPAVLGLCVLAVARGIQAVYCKLGGDFTMMAVVILLLSVAALLQFFATYCRSLIAASSKQALSPEVKDVTGLVKGATGEDFARVIQL